MKISKIFTLIGSMGFLLNPLSCFGNVYKEKCGDTTFVVKNVIEDSSPQYNVYYIENEKDEKFLYRGSFGNLYAACIRGINGNYLLIEETCGGSICSDFGEYRIFDAATKKILLNEQPLTAEDEIDVPKDDDSNMAQHIRIFNHEKRNFQAAEKILGFPPPPLPDIDKFCCNNS